MRETYDQHRETLQRLREAYLAHPALFGITVHGSRLLWRDYADRSRGVLAIARDETQMLSLVAAALKLLRSLRAQAERRAA